MKYLSPFVLLILFHCSLVQKIFMPRDPEFKVESVNIHRADMEGFVLKIDTRLINHYRFGLPESVLELDVRVNKQGLTRVTSEKFQVGAGSSVTFPLYLEIKYDNLWKTVRSFLQETHWTLSVEGGSKMNLNIAGYPKQIFVPFKLEKSIPAFIPDIKIEDFQLQIERFSMDNTPLGMPKLKFLLRMNIANKAGSEFSIFARDFSFQLANQDIIKIEPVKTSFSKQQYLDLSFELPSTQTILNIIKNPANSYELKGNLQFLFPEDTDISRFSMPLEYRGKFTGL